MTEHVDPQSPHTRERVLLAALAHVPFDGWSQAALTKGCKDAGLDDDASRLAFPEGVPELVEYFSTYADEKMTSVLVAENLEAMKIRDRITTAVRVRLELLARHREAVRRTATYFAMPQNTALGLKCLARTIDAIWRAVGDQATDFSYYTKRMSLAGVYGSTLLHWLNDDSEGFADSFAFLDRRIGDVMKIHKVRERFSRGLDDVMSRVGSWFNRPSA